MTEETQPMAAAPSSAAAPVSGIGGWLVLPMLGMIATPIVQLINLMGLGDTLSHLDQLGPWISNLVVIEAILNFALFVVGPALLLIQFFGKRRIFPRWYVIWTIAGAVFVVLDLFVGYAAFHDAYEANGISFFNQDTLRALAGSLIGVCVWVPYMLNSIRVRNTFVN